MIVVIQCAATKSPRAKRLHTVGGREVLFVASPADAPKQPDCVYARPDDLAGAGQTWRQFVSDYNQRAENPLALLPAYQLYENPVYQRLVTKFGISNVLVLSAGWGLVNAEFLLPDYDITFSASAPSFKRRRKSDVYKDFVMLPQSPDCIAFIGGKDYLPLFVSLSKDVAAQKIVFFNSSTAPSLPPGYVALRYLTTTRTNWHYGCANDLIYGHLDGEIRSVGVER
jgi:hypothetical protein